MVPIELLSTFFPVKQIILVAWLGFGLIASGIAAATGGKRAFAWTLGATWIVIPTAVALFILVSNQLTEKENRVIIQELTDEYRKLCDAPDREVIRRTVDGVEEVAFAPDRGPEDQWGNDLFFPNGGGGPSVSAQWIAGPKNGRYGGYRRVAVLSAIKGMSAAPRYHVLFKHLTDGWINGRATIHGVEIQILDSLTNEVIADRRDYMGTLRNEFVFPTGCAGRAENERRKWHQDHLAFIRKVLIPPPGVQIVRKDIPIPHDREKRFPIKPEDFPLTVVGKVLSERPPTGRLEPVDKYLPLGVEYRYSPREDRRGKYTDRDLVLLKAERDIKIGQGLGEYYSNLLAAQIEQEELVAVFAAGLRSDAGEPFLILRRFSLQGDLLYQARVVLSKRMAPRTYIESPDHKIQSGKTEYRIWIGLRADKGYGVDLEISIPRAALTRSDIVKGNG